MVKSWRNYNLVSSGYSRNAKMKRKEPNLTVCIVVGVCLVSFYRSHHTPLQMCLHIWASVMSRVWSVGWTVWHHQHSGTLVPSYLLGHSNATGRINLHSITNTAIPLRINISKWLTQHSTQKESGRELETINFAMLTVIYQFEARATLVRWGRKEKKGERKATIDSIRDLVTYTNPPRVRPQNDARHCELACPTDEFICPRRSDHPVAIATW